MNVFSICIFQCLGFNFAFDRRFCWVKNSILTVLIFQYFKDIVPCLLVCTVSDEKFAVILIFIPLYIMYLFSLVDFLFISDFKEFDMMCCGVVLFIFLMLGIYWASCFCVFIFFIILENNLSIISKIFYPLMSPVLGTLITHVFHHLKLSQSLMMLIFFNSFSLLCFI